MRRRRRIRYRRTAKFGLAPLAVIVLVAGGIGYIASSAYTASNTVPATNVGQYTHTVDANALEPAACSGVLGNTLTSIVTVASGATYAPASISHALILGAGGNETITPDAGSGNCVVGGDGVDKVNMLSASSQVCILSAGGIANQTGCTSTSQSTNPQAIGFSATSGPAGGTITVNGYGFTASSTVTTHTWDGGALTLSPATPSTDSSGHFSATFTVPSAIAGAHTVSVTDAGGKNATLTFTVTPAVATPSPTSGEVGLTGVTVAGTGFAASHALTATVDGYSAIITAGGTSTSSGNASVTFTVPHAPGGSQTFTISDGTNHASSAFTVDSAVGTPSPTSGAVGSSVTITGTGFASSAALTVTFGSVPATITSGGTSSVDGDTSVTFTVPFSGNGAYPVKLGDGTSTVTSGTSYTVSGSFAGIDYTTVTVSGGSATCSSATIAQATTCTAMPLGGTGWVQGYVTFVTAARAAVTNTSGGSYTVTSSETTVTSPGGTVSPASSTIANSASSTAGTFRLTGKGVGWKGTMTCSVTVNGVTYTVAVTGN